jgi:hypothetical protein
MIKIRATLVFTVLTALGSASIFFSSCKNNSTDEKIIFTRAAGEQMKSYNLGDSNAYSLQTQIVSIDPQEPENSFKILSKEFYSAKSPAISYDGNFMLFSGKLQQNDTWQIWEMNLGNNKSRLITNTPDNCAFPAYLPGGRMVFSKFAAKDSLKAGYSIFTANLDGSSLQRITFNPEDYLGINVLNDGRVLTMESQVYPEKGKRMIMVLRPDGTKLELFYKPTEDFNLNSTARETINGRIVFIENQKDGEKGNLVSINYNRPLHSRINLTTGLEGDFLSVCPQSSGKMLVSYRKSASERYSLCEFDPEGRNIGKVIYSDKGFDVLEAVVAAKHERPKKLPSEVDMGVKTGLILCQNVNVLGGKPLTDAMASSGIQIMGIDSVLGKVDAAADGSFFLKVIADKPFRIQTIDKSGHVQQNICGWISLRPNERRGCVGCHEDPEIVPGNSVPLSVKLAPVNIPMHINKVVEKKVSLE